MHDWFQWQVLMVMLDVPKAKKEKLTIELIQRGIDLYGIAMVGGSWNEGGGHSSGRKVAYPFRQHHAKQSKNFPAACNCRFS
jgi:hypothetical protein